RDRTCRYKLPPGPVTYNIKKYYSAKESQIHSPAFSQTIFLWLCSDLLLLHPAQIYHTRTLEKGGMNPWQLVEDVQDVVKYVILQRTELRISIIKTLIFSNVSFPNVEKFFRVV